MLLTFVWIRIVLISLIQFLAEIMGSLMMADSLSLLLAKIFVDETERNIHEYLFEWLLILYKYVNDIIACFNGINTKL